MNKQAWMIVSAMAAAALPWACGGSNGTGTSTGTGGSSSSHSATSSHSSTAAVSTGAGGGDGGADCTMVLSTDPCDTCTAMACCTQVNDCNADPNCLSCYNGTATDTTVCGVGATMTTLNALTACSQAHCAMACAPMAPVCNPITTAGCPMAGYACDFASDQNGNPTYACYAPPNDVALCGSCDDMATFCMPGLSCINASATGQCAKYCCSDGDCGTGVCDLTLVPDGLGLCVTSATIDAGTELPSCDAPAVAPSHGACLQGFDGGVPPQTDAGYDGSTPPADAGADG